MFRTIVGRKEDDLMLNRTIALARCNRVEGLPAMAALIVNKRGRIIAQGINQRKSHPLQAKFSRFPGWSYLHAEIAALVDARGEDLSDATMYIARVLKDGTPALAKPCKGCQKALIAFGLKDVIWTL